METALPCGLVWLRRDLRVHDNAALYHALKHCRQVHVVFVFDTAILDPLPRADRRVEFLRDSLAVLDSELRALAESHGVKDAGRVGLICRPGARRRPWPPNWVCKRCMPATTMIPTP